MLANQVMNNISKYGESSMDILNESHRLKHDNTNCQRPRNGRDFDKNESTIEKMNASCINCAIMKRGCITLAKISMDYCTYTYFSGIIF